MVQMQTYLNVADNSGAKRVQCIKVLGGSHRMIAGVGDIIVVDDDVPELGSLLQNVKIGGIGDDGIFLPTPDAEQGGHKAGFLVVAALVLDPKIFLQIPKLLQKGIFAVHMHQSLL